MTHDTGPVFLERQAYRRRRMADAAKLLPVFGVFLICLPLMWSSGDNGLSTTSAMLYLFGVWGLIALLSALVSRYLRSGDEDIRSEDK